MLYDSASNSLVFAAGAVRPQAGNPNADDYTNTWTFDLSKIGTPQAAWVEQDNIPYGANHIRYVLEPFGDMIALRLRIYELMSPCLRVCFAVMFRPMTTLEWNTTTSSVASKEKTKITVTLTMSWNTMQVPGLPELTSPSLEVMRRRQRWLTDAV